MYYLRKVELLTWYLGNMPVNVISAPLSFLDYSMRYEA